MAAPRVEATRSRALLALLLLAPVPSLGVLAAMVIAPGPVGKAVFAAAKIWLLAFPAFWHLVVERGRLSWSPTTREGLLAGLATGIAMAAAIVLGAWAFNVPGMDTEPLRMEVGEMGLDTPLAYLAGAASWVFMNSVMEEYVYRWFVLRQCEALMAKWPAIGLAATIFTAHHVIAVSQYLEPGFTVLASFGVFFGGAVWSWLYFRYRSIWPGWLSHAIADVAVFGLGWYLLFG
ncbi:MAG: type II CAAX endopeptidase family protein [Holophagae bacterium]